VASFVTAGTALSGPLRERLVASASRLMLYLGRSGEYITVFSMFCSLFRSRVPRDIGYGGRGC
jgi:predicted nucleic acid-binding Zn finger protein